MSRNRTHEILRKIGVPLVTILALGSTGCAAANAERPPTVAAATQSGDKAPATTPSASETKTASPEKWLPTRGDFLSPDNMAGMNDDELREACTISVDDPDAQTPEGIIRLWEYISISTLNGPTTPDQIAPYLQEDGQIGIPVQEEFMKDVTEHYTVCMEALLNDGKKRDASNFGKYVADVFAAQENLDPDHQSEVYRVESEVVGDVEVDDDNTYTYTVNETDNFARSFAAKLGSNWTTQWGGHHKVSVHVSTKDGNFVFTNRDYEVTAS